MNTCPEVVTQQYGTLPYFESAIGCFDLPDDRQAVYAAKHALGDRHCLIECYSTRRSIYDEAGQPYQGVISPNWEADLPGFRDRVAEIIVNGFVPLVIFDGDDGDHTPFGAANALRQLPMLVDLFKHPAGTGTFNDYILYGRLWDGVFYGSSPEHIQEFGDTFRRVLPNGYLCIEHQPGRIPCGEGGDDWLPGGRMAGYDALLAEFDYANDIPPNDTIWQVAGRTIRPYHRPPDQPSGDDPNPPFYLVDSARGPRYACAFEWEGTYFRVRRRSTIEQEAQRRAYLVTLGYQYTG